MNNNLTPARMEAEERCPQCHETRDRCIDNEYCGIMAKLYPKAEPVVTPTLMREVEMHRKELIFENQKLRQDNAQLQYALEQSESKWLKVAEPVAEDRTAADPFIDVINWLMGCNGDFEAPAHDSHKAFWWRGELRKRLGLEYDGKKYIMAEPIPERKMLLKLSNEISGWMGWKEHGLRDLLGNTNVTVMREKLDMAREMLGQSAAPELKGQANSESEVVHRAEEDVKAQGAVMQASPSTPSTGSYESVAYAGKRSDSEPVPSPAQPPSEHFIRQQTK